MKRLFATVGALLGLASPALGQGKSAMITIKSGNEEIKAFLAEPEGKGPFPAIVVIQEWWGLTDWIKDNAKHFAKQGYVALAPDLYRGKVTDSPKVAMTLKNGMPNDRALRDLKASIDALSAMPNVDKNKIGSIGWCMGGGLSLRLALHDPRDRACALCYGAVVTDADMLKSLKAPVLGIFGEDDKGIPAAKVDEFEKAFKGMDWKYQIQIYADAGHGFMRPTNNPAYAEAAAREAWKQIDAFFAKTLKKR